jgi:DNA-binding XRE family transcriptional regulator
LALGGGSRWTATTARIAPLPDLVTSALVRIGADIALARKRRSLTQARLAASAGITLPSLRAIERGNPTTGIGLYFTVLWALGLELVHLVDASGDRVGLTLEASRAPQRVRPPGVGTDDDF